MKQAWRGHECYSGSNIYIVDQEGKSIAVTDAEHKSIICAAPALLEQLQTLLSFVKHYNGTEVNYRIMFDARVRAAQAAIDAATKITKE